jgi:histone-lysine N-methyltransferase SETDB1
VVQNGLTVRLQLFRTQSKGWGLRCLDDLPKGAFVCTYAGHLLTDTMSNVRGKELGDEYFADLDFIDLIQNIREPTNEESTSSANNTSNIFDSDSEASTLLDIKPFPHSNFSNIYNSIFLR